MGINDRELDRKQDAKAARRDKQAADDGWRGFVNVELSDSQKKAVKATLNKGAEQWARVIDLVMDGYKLTVSFDDRNTSFVFAMTCRDPNDDNRGLTLTARGGSLASAVAAWVYKHDEILKGRWDKAAEITRGRMTEDDVG